MNKLMYVVGVPGSGKSTFAQELAKREYASILSTDDIRQELFGDSRKQKNTRIIYEELFSRAQHLLSQHHNVIIDATNIDRKKRMKGLSKFSNVYKECFYLDTPLAVCLSRNAVRKRKVDETIINKMYKFFEFPMLGEGWDDIHIVHTPSPYRITQDDLQHLLSGAPSKEALFDSLSPIPALSEMVHFNQENPHHLHSLCWHTYHVLSYISKHYEESDKLALQIAALFHDSGKPLTKVFKKGRDYASYFLHENVSAHLCAHFLKELDFEDAFIFKVCNLISMHMKIVYGGDEGASEIYHLLGSDYLWKLYFFAEGDTQAKQ